MLSVSDVIVGVWNSGDYTIELGVSRDLKAFLKIKTVLQLAQFGYNDWNFLY
jgi:hypothetical protein